MPEGKNRNAGERSMGDVIQDQRFWHAQGRQNVLSSTSKPKR